MKRFVYLCATGLGVVLPACGSLTSNTSASPALATLQGTLVNPNSLDVSSHDAVRVAVVWRGNGGPRQFNVAEDLPVQPVFPSAFTIALDGPPPAGAMNPFFDSSPPSNAPVHGTVASAGQGASQAPLPDAGVDEAGAGPLPATAPSQTPTSGSPGSLYAIGTVVAYLDQNHNGKLDLVADDASAYVDQILAANQEMSIAYFQGPIPDMPFGGSIIDASGHRPKQGYNLVRTSVCPPSNPACPWDPDAGVCAPMPLWLGMDTPYPLKVASSPEVASLMCLNPSTGPSGLSSSLTHDPAEQPAQYPLASDPNLCCASDGTDYFYATCTQVSYGLCQGTLQICTSVGYTRPTPTPPAWPCAK
jgi:hypothetical protein